MSYCCFALAVIAWAMTSPSPADADVIESLENWLSIAELDRQPIEDQAFAQSPLTKAQAAEASRLLWKDHMRRIKAERGDEWENKLIRLGDLAMKFDFRIFGEKPPTGRSLYISMHGGGNAPARTNDRQWQNQIGLYEPEEGLYLAPRAPTNTWNLWHEPHIDRFFTRIIEDATVLAEVDPNRVYIMGYSAGGDGVYQLAPRMADQLAAAAMMAGHPNDASPLGLRNIGFTLHMGGEDAAYNRNQVAAQWKERLAELKKNDPPGYEHEVMIHEGLGHWMNREDQVAVPWMAKFARQPLPSKVVWRQANVTHSRFYWLAVDKENEKGGAEVVVSRQGQRFIVERADKISSLIIRLNDRMIDLDQPVTVRMGDRDLFDGKVDRAILSLYRTLTERGDRDLVFSGEVIVSLD